MAVKKHIISGIVPGSIAEELEIEPGDELCEMNGAAIDTYLIISITWKMNIWRF